MDIRLYRGRRTTPRPGKALVQGRWDFLSAQLAPAPATPARRAARRRTADRMPG